MQKLRKGSIVHGIGLLVGLALLLAAWPAGACAWRGAGWPSGRCFNRVTPNGKAKNLEGPTYNTFDSTFWNINTWQRK